MKKLFKKVVGYAAFALAALVPALSANAVTKTFYYDDSSTNYRNTGSSTGVAVHIWKDGGADYPHSPIEGTVVEGTDGKIYKFVIEDNNYNRFIFKPTDSWDGQSNDLKTTIEDKALYKADGPRQTVYISQSNYSEPSEPKGRWYLQGNNPMSWSNEEARELKYNESTNCYELTYTIPASTDFKFVLNSNNKDTYYRTKGNGDDNNNDEVELGADEQLYDVGNNMYTRTEMKDVKIQIYKSDSNWKVRFGASPTTDIKVICKNTANWDNVKISYWGDGQSAKTYDMTKSSDDLWEYTISETWTLTGFKFTDGSDKEYVYNGAPVDNTTYTNGDPTPGEISWYLQGDNPMSWSNDKARELKYNESTNCYELTYTIPASTDFKFVLNSNNKDTYYRTKGNGDDNNNDEVELGADEQLYDVGNNMYTRTEMKDVKIQIYKSDSNWKVRFGASPTPGEGPAPKGNWYIWGADEKSLGNWNENQMREFMRQEDGTYKLSVYLKNNSDFQVRFKAENSSSYLNYKYGNDGGANAELKDKDDQELFRVDHSMYTLTEGAYTLKIYFNDSKWHMTADLECQSTGDLYLLGDINNWMNDGTYKVESQNKYYNYDYSKAVNGTRAQYQFVQCPVGGLISGNFKGSDGWYVLDLAKTTTRGNIWGQFTIVRDKGLFVAAKKAENRTDGRDVINWDKGFDQWQHEFDRLNNGSPNQDYLDEDIEAFTIAESSSVGVYDKDSNPTGKIYKSKGGGANFHLAHNMYTKAKVLFNVNKGEVCIYSDDKPTDFYIYLSTDADRKDNEPADKYVGIIKESMNSVNYTVNFKDFAVDSQTGTAMNLCEDKQKFPNGLVYTKYWKIKIPNGIEGPAGQKFNVNIKGSKGYRESKYSTIFLNDLYIIDGLKAFAKAEDQTVESVQYRLYGYPADGDVNNLVIIDTKTGEEKPASEAADSEYGWVTLKYGEYSYHPYSTSWWHSGEDESIIKADFTTKTYGFYPDIKDSSTNEYYSIPAEHAMKFIQWRIIYKGSQNVQGMRKAAGEKRLVPETLTVDRSNPKADWVLNGTHKEIMVGIATGVEDIEMEDGEISEEGEAVAPVYYNLQGVRVAEPQHGLYIKVTGNKSEKILVK